MQQEVLLAQEFFGEGVVPMLSSMSITAAYLLTLLLVMLITAKAWATPWWKDAHVRTASFVEQNRKLWDDLAPPFSIEDRALSFGSESEDFDGRIVTHFCFLIHGHRGLSKDLSYLHTVMRETTEREIRRAADSAAPDERHDIVIHNAVCNEGKTTDGIANGGERLVDEMLHVIRSEMDRSRTRKGLRDEITISVVGNSLGGIYGRYAVAKLKDRLMEEADRATKRQRPDSSHKDDEPLLDNKYRVHFNVFCTTATPHLGVSGHTYLPLPRTAEIGIGHAMGSTGRDLFRLNDLMKTMATSPQFLKPLRSFRKRVAYANAYGTDFVVPSQTAAFLSEKSHYPHHFVEVDGNDNLVWDDYGLIVATLETPQHTGEHDYPHLNQENTDELVQMSTALDSLGWKKVFVDFRSNIPLSASVPLRRNSSSLDDDSDSTPPLHELRQRRVVKSQDVANALGTSGDNTIRLPMGHNMICAFSRNRLFTLMNKSGRPVMDNLAQELVQDILNWRSSE